MNLILVAVFERSCNLIVRTEITEIAEQKRALVGGGETFISLMRTTAPRNKMSPGSKRSLRSYEKADENNPKNPTK